MIKNFFDMNTVLSIAGLIIGITGIFLAIFFYFRSRRSKKPFYSLRSFNLISERLQKYQDIKILFRNEPVNNLTMTKVALWNGGNDTINYQDLAQSDLLRISPKEGILIYDVELIFQSNPTCQFKTNIINNELIIYFDYFDQNQGCVVQVTHSGKRSSDLQVYGTVKGTGRIKESKLNSWDLKIVNSVAILLLPYLRSSKREKRLFATIIPWFIFLTGLIVAGLYFIIKTNSPDKVALLLSGGLYILIGIALLIRRNPLPNNFGLFFEDE